MAECSTPYLINLHEKGDDKDISDMSFANQGLDKTDQCVSKVQHDGNLAGENNEIERYYTPVQTVRRRVDLKDGSTYFDTPRPWLPENSGNHGHLLEYDSPTPKSSWPRP
ncbi:2422_t:CDS:1, partial [Dentiscutata heterogama]